MEVRESTIEAMADITIKWGRDEISCEVAMHGIWALFRRDEELSISNQKVRDLSYL